MLNGRCTSERFFTSVSYIDKNFIFSLRRAIGITANFPLAYQYSFKTYDIYCLSVYLKYIEDP